MHPDLAAGTWRKLQQHLAVDYPKRFGDIRLFTGPTYGKPNGQIQRPAGSPFLLLLRNRLSPNRRSMRPAWQSLFHLPNTADTLALRDCICSIADIEARTGLNFLPAMDYAPRESLRNWISPGLGGWGPQAAVAGLLRVDKCRRGYLRIVFQIPVCLWLLSRILAFVFAVIHCLAGSGEQLALLFPLDGIAQPTFRQRLRCIDLQCSSHHGCRILGHDVILSREHPRATPKAACRRG